MKLKPGWHILRYLDISWEETPWTRAFGGMVCPPDVFADHVKQLSTYGRFVPPGEGLKSLLVDNVEEPLISFWFDGGFRGVREHALPLLQERQVTAAMSACSRFWNRREMWWLCQISFLRHSEGLRQLADKLSAAGWDGAGSMLDAVLTHASPTLMKDLYSLYMRYASDVQRKNGFRLFETPDGLQALADAGWELANFTAGGAPVGWPAGLAQIEEQFRECERAFQTTFEKPSRFWVLPLDEAETRSPELAERFQTVAGDCVLALCGDRVNTAQNAAAGVICRSTPPLVKGRAFRNFLKEIQ